MLTLTFLKKFSSLINTQNTLRTTIFGMVYPRTLSSGCNLLLLHRTVHDGNICFTAFSRVKKPAIAISSLVCNTVRGHPANDINLAA